MGKIARSAGGCCLPFVGFIFYHHSDNSLMNDLSNRFVILSLSLSPPPSGIRCPGRRLRRALRRDARTRFMVTFQPQSLKLSTHVVHAITARLEMAHRGGETHPNRWRSGHHREKEGDGKGSLVVPFTIFRHVPRRTHSVN